MDYNDFVYLFPPRPETKVPQSTLGFYEKRGWIAQAKKNGTNTVIFCRGDTVIFKQRHQDETGLGLDHKQWSPLPIHIEAFQGLSDKWNVFHAELLHSKTKHIKHHLYIHDILVHEGQQLVGKNLLERRELLERMISLVNAEERDDLFYINEHFSVAKNLTSGFAARFNPEALKPEDEGVVLKNPLAKLEPCFKETANRSWQVKSRIPHPNYGF